jgi:hypothetical protein
MKYSVFSRMVGVLFLYLGIFVVLVTVQFTKQRGFTQNIGSMTVSGYYGEPPVQMADIGGEAVPAVYLLKDRVTVSFGGMEFRLHGNSEFGLLRSGGDKENILPQTLSVSDNSAVFTFKDETQLIFNTSAIAGVGSELRITGQFGEEYEGLEIPFRPLRTSRIWDTGNSQFVITAEGIQYSFSQSRLDGGRRVLILDAGDSVASYRAVPEQKVISPYDFALPAAKNEVQYNGTVDRWRDEAYSLWSAAVRNAEDESLVTAFAGESAGRGVYQEAITGISPAFIRRLSWTYHASVYLGRLDMGLRTLSIFEKDTAARLSALITARSSAFFLEPHIIDFCGIRGYGQFIDAAAGLANSLEPASLSPDLIPGILEAYVEWPTYRSPGDNPFEGLIESACLIISDGIWRSGAGDRVLYFRDALADMEYNLRLGLALDQYGRQSGRDDWGVLGRSLVLSVLSFTENGRLPAKLSISGPEENKGGSEIPDTVIPAPGSARIDSFALYRWFPAATYPHAVSIGGSVNGIWAWTTSASVTVSQENNILDISVSFMPGETHYMLIRNLRPFVKIQLYGIDYRTDPQFERYDSSGWSYSSSEQTLLLKLKHRIPVEHIRVFY